MPKAPTCRKCGNPHWSTERCARIETVKREHLIPFEPLILSPPQAPDEIIMTPYQFQVLGDELPLPSAARWPGLAQLEGVKTVSDLAGPKPKRDRKAYMREFMRKKRKAT